MSKAAFNEFINKGLKEKKNCIKRKEEYLAKVNQLYEQVRSYLNEFSEAIQLSYETIKIDEEYIGEYNVPSLKMDIFGKQVSLIPIGMYILGSPGRVDLVSDLETKRFPCRP